MAAEHRSDTDIRPLAPSAGPAAASVREVATAVYALQAASFIVGITFIVAVIVNYVKRDDARGTRVESHFRWQIRTFWFGLLWSLVGSLTAVVGVGYLILLGVGVWIIYRIVKGWLRLNDGRPMYVP